MPLPAFRPTKIRIAFGSALVVLSAAALLSFWDIARVRETALEIADANVVLDRLDDVLEAFRESVSASRGVARRRSARRIARPLRQLHAVRVLRGHVDGEHHLLVADGVDELEAVVADG